MNRRLPPMHYVASEGRVFFVEGVTSDDSREWELMTALRSFDGIIVMSTIQRVADIPNHEWHLTPWGHRPKRYQLLTFMMLVGNMQRAMMTLRPVKL